MKVNVHPGAHLSFFPLKEVAVVCLLQALLIIRGNFTVSMISESRVTWKLTMWWRGLKREAIARGIKGLRFLNVLND
jgi:hypothetical protein